MDVLIALDAEDGAQHKHYHPETADHRVVTLDRHWISQLLGVRVGDVVSTERAPSSRVWGDALAYAEWRHDLLGGDL